MHAGVMLTAAFGLCACGGNVKNAQTHEVESERYSQPANKKSIVN